MSFAPTLLQLLFGHALADYPLQGDFLARGKNPLAPLPGIPWWQCMCAHAMIHAGLVLLITGSVVLALCEFAMHFAIDVLKCQGDISFNYDQALHVVFKIIYAVIVVFG